MSFWACKVCSAKESQISSLQDEVKFLRSLLGPTTKSSHGIPLLDLERDAIMSGTQEVIEITERAVPPESDEDIAAEATRIFAGNY